MQPGRTGLSVHLFGHFEVCRDGVPLSRKAWGRRKTEDLCKLLASDRSRSFTRDQLIEALFPGLDPDKAFHNLTGRISELRRALEPNLLRPKDSQFILNAEQECYCFNKVAACWVDREEFEKGLAAAQASEQAERWGEALVSYLRAVDLYRGDFLDEDQYEEWTLATRERLHGLHLQALARMAECHTRLGHYREAIEQIKRVIETQPADETAYRQLMLYQYYAGDSQKAVQAYETCVRALREHLDVEPSVETEQLRDSILRGKIVPPVKAVPHNLPAPLTRFIGREEESKEIREGLCTTRLLTLTGAGGSGKTRLALKVANDLLDEFDDGVWWVELAALADPAFVPQALAAALGVKEAPGRPLIEMLTNYLRPKRALVALDNCEHLIEASAQLAQPCCRDVRI
jgi:DNA-binding SARP family transcriptional activator